jgi:hypothetical protein
MKSVVVFLLLILTMYHVHGQNSGIEGKIVDQGGMAVPFVSIGVEKGGLGSIADAEGNYRFPLPPGKYQVLFHCLGYKTESQEVEITSGFKKLDVQLSEQILQTQEVLIAAGNEDPANSIIRKSIARSKINQLLVDSYKAEAYIRGSFRILKVPFLFRNKLKKEFGIDPNAALFKETLETIEFKQPATFIEKVISSRSNLGKNLSQNVSFPLGNINLYKPKTMGFISPLAPNAFAYYSFQYLGAFSDYGLDVFKIKVSPKRRTEGLWSGEISIVDGLWCIHSFQVNGSNEGSSSTVSQSYQPVEGIWLPSQVRFSSKSSRLGFEIEGSYNAGIRKYRIIKNEKLFADFKKLEQKLDESTTAIIKENPAKTDLKKKEKDDRKMLRQLARAALKEKLNLQKKENREMNRSTTIYSERIFLEDSTAINSDTNYWNENRMIPLTRIEEQSFARVDSSFRAAEQKDSLKKEQKSKINQINEFLLLGKTLRFGKKDSLNRQAWELKIFSPAQNLGINAVEGYHFQQENLLKRYFGQKGSKFSDQRSYIQFGPEFRYSFGRRRWLLSGLFQYGRPRWTIQLSGGSKMSQYADVPVISDAVNTLYARFADRNLMKLYQADFLRLDFLQKLNNQFELEASFRVEDRIVLPNVTFKSIYGKNFQFEPNNINIPSGSGFSSNPGRITEIRLAFTWCPGLESRLFNEQQIFRKGNSPIIQVQLRHALPGVFRSDADFTRLEMSWTQSISFGRSSVLSIYGRASGFLGDKEIGRMDGNHIQGNQTLFIGKNNLEQFRNLPYYQYSNASRLAEVHTQLYQKKLLVGWLFPDRKKWTEGILTKILITPKSKPVYEFGYGIDRLLGLFNLNVVHSGIQPSIKNCRMVIGTRIDLTLKPKTLERSPDRAIR